MPFRDTKTHLILQKRFLQYALEIGWKGAIDSVAFFQTALGLSQKPHARARSTRVLYHMKETYFDPGTWTYNILDIGPTTFIKGYAFSLSPVPQDKSQVLGDLDISRQRLLALGVGPTFGLPTFLVWHDVLTSNMIESRKDFGREKKKKK